MPDQITVTQPVQRTLRVLVVEDETRYRAFLMDVLHEMACTPLGASSAGEAMRLIDAAAPDALLLDLNLPVVDGMTFLEAFRRTHPEVPVVIITGFGDLKAAQRAIQFGVTEFLTKPCHLGQIEMALDRVRRRLSRTAARKADDDSPIESPPRERDDVQSLAAMERAAIIDALRSTQGNRSTAAARLGISRRALYNKIAEYRRDGYEVP